MITKPHILDYQPAELKAKLTTICEKPFQVKQILQWIYLHHTIDFTQMTNISKSLQARLIDKFDNTLPTILDVQTSYDETTKFLLNLHDDCKIEMVYMPSEAKNTLCISTQVGCARQCKFCATATIGLKRNLTTAEILSQFILANQYFSNKLQSTGDKQANGNSTEEIPPPIPPRLNGMGGKVSLRSEGGYDIYKKLTNIVLMGMGEPFDNFDNVLSALKILQAEDGFSFSGRRITLSTSGVVPKIYELVNSALPAPSGQYNSAPPVKAGGGRGGVKLKLAISLNSAIDSKRSQIMPINDLYPLAELKKAVQYFRKHSHFRVTFEYIMIANFNMGQEDIKALTKFCGDISCKINLIKWNEVPNSDWKCPTDDEVADFIQKISHIPNAVTLRKSRGSDIDGACGQLAGKQR